ncbi:MAG: ArsR/SmtB family transcription factor [Nitrososphaerales archaeon]
MTEVRSRLGSFAVIKIGQMVLISPCDTRMRILEALSKRSLTGDELARKTSVSYSCIMDHMEFLEKLGIVKVSLQKTEEGRRRIHFHFSEDPLEGIQELFMASTKRNGSRRRNEVVAVL